MTKRAEIRRHVGGPVPFDIIMTVAGVGVVEDVQLWHRADMAPSPRFELFRALCFVLDALAFANDEGELAEDVIARLPPGSVARFERQILEQVAFVQAQCLRRAGTQPPP